MATLKVSFKHVWDLAKFVSVIEGFAAQSLVQSRTLPGLLH